MNNIRNRVDIFIEIIDFQSSNDVFSTKKDCWEIFSI